MIVGSHGIFSNGSRTTDKMLAACTSLGMDAMGYDWGIHGPFSAALCLDDLAQELCKRLQFASNFTEGVPSAFAHSFGNTILYRAMQMGARFDRIWMFNPVLDPEVEFPDHAYSKIVVIANEDDAVVKWARRLLWWAKFGDMGRVGYQGPSERVKTYWGSSAPLGGALGEHGKSFEGNNAKGWAQHFFEELNETKNTPTGETS